jgi:TolB-like protein/Flp pilus assembly protein TadD
LGHQNYSSTSHSRAATPDGIKRDKDVERSDSVTGPTAHGLNYVIVALLAIALVYFVYESRFSGKEDAMDTSPVVAAQGARSIAVLPFATFGNEADSYLSDGLAETLLNLLAQIDDLQVAARTSAFKFKDTNEDIRVIGEQLGVATVLEGSIQRSGNRIRIAAQLINVDDGFHMYSETFERELDDIFAIQDEIASAVVDALEVELLGIGEHSKPEFDAYETLAQLRSRLRTSTGDEMIEIIAALEKLTRDYPDYADAYASLSAALTLHGVGAGLIPEETTEKAIAAGQRAIELEPDNAMGFVALGGALQGRGMFRQLSPIIARALELQPGNADVLAMQGVLLANDGRYQEAFEITSKALLRDPLNPVTRGLLAERHRDLGQHDKALAVLNAGIDIDPADIPLQMNRALFLEETGNFRQALRAFDEVLRADPDIPNARQMRFYIYFNSDDLHNSKVALEQAEAVSVERLADERALYCYLLGNTECWHAATALMLATRDRFFVQTWQARMLYEGGLVDEAIAALLPVVAYFDDTSDPYGNLETRVNLAALYRLSDQADLAAAAMQPVVFAFDEALANGYDHHELHRYRAAAAVIEGDNDEAMRLLEEAYARGFRHVSDLYYLYAIDQLRDDARYAALIERMYRENAEQLSGL